MIFAGLFVFQASGVYLVFRSGGWEGMEKAHEPVKSEPVMVMLLPFGNRENKLSFYGNLP